EHRKQPYFPEVSSSGWTWTDRESLFTASLPRASVILTGTETGKQEIVHYYRVNPENVGVIPLPVPASALMRPSCGPAEIKSKYGIDCDFLFYPAQFWPHKNHINLLRALKILTDQNRLDIMLVLTGSDKGNLAHVLNEIDRLGLSGRVVTPGFLPREDLNALFRAATALVFPSYFGPDNLPPLEAFALGVPVAASDIAGAKEQLGEAALLFDPSDPLDIAAKITKLCQHSRLREELIAKGAATARTRIPDAYIAKLCSRLDKFEKISRCWDSSYRHS
ncbi:MAG: glycosyltransferase family 4 protein, partial [Methylocapsa sp.]|nr:glycosyltransferase family 4 protein [Methylocapsa sp.]